MVEGYIELLKNAASKEELYEVGKHIALYLDTVAPNIRDERRSLLERLYRRSMLDIKTVGRQPADITGDREIDAPELDMEPATLDLRDLYMHNHVRVLLSSWMARKKGCPADMVGEIVHQTEKAILFRHESVDFQWEGWLPKSQIRILPVSSGE